jgi:hypothetical protein
MAEGQQLQSPSSSMLPVTRHRLSAMTAASSSTRFVPRIFKKALDAMELEMDFATAKCPHCGAVNLFPGFTEVVAFRATRRPSLMILNQALDFSGIGVFTS